MTLEILMVVIGVLANYLNEVIKNGADAKAYWLQFRLNALLSILGAVAATVLLITAGNTDLYAYLMAGYISDSVFNRSPVKAASPHNSI